MRHKFRRGGRNNGASRVYYLLFAAIGVAGVFFLLGGMVKKCTYNIDEGGMRRVLSIVGVKKIQDIGKTYQDLEAKYEAGLQTIKSLQLKMERTMSDVQLGSVNNDAIPGIKPLQEGEDIDEKKVQQEGSHAHGDHGPRLMAPPEEPKQLPIQKGAMVASSPKIESKNVASSESKNTNLRGVVKLNSVAASSNERVSGLTALVVICYNRPNYLTRVLDKIFEYYRADRNLAIFVSQDGRMPPVVNVVDQFIAKFKKKFPGSPVPVHLYHRQSPMGNGYMKLAQHFRFALNEIFVQKGFARVIILEDDLEIAPDFFDYFHAMAPILDNDDTVMAISAWNDNGFDQYTTDPSAVVRSDFFPGLGWMLNKRLWDEWGPKWPKGYWDDWLREPAQRKNRVTLRPEISRTFTFGKKGVSHAQFYDKFLGRIVLNHEIVDWSKQDFSYLKKEEYDKHFQDAVEQASISTTTEARRSTTAGNALDHDIKIFYKSLDRGPQPSYRSIAAALGVMGDSKARVPRTGYLGIVALRGGHGSKYRIFIAPSADVSLT